MKRGKELSLAYRRARAKREQLSRREREGEFQGSATSGEKPQASKERVEARSRSPQASAPTTE